MCPAKVTAFSVSFSDRLTIWCNSSQWNISRHCWAELPDLPSLFALLPISSCPEYGCDGNRSLSPCICFITIFSIQSCIIFPKDCVIEWHVLLSQIKQIISVTIPAHYSNRLPINILCSHINELDDRKFCLVFPLYLLVRTSTNWNLSMLPKWKIFERANVHEFLEQIYLIMSLGLNFSICKTVTVYLRNHRSQGMKNH